MDKVEIFELEISRFNPSGANITTEIILPATIYELADALDQARITDEHIYSLEILNCELEYLPQFISHDVNLYELNHLANRLSALSQWELDCFEGMVMMDAVQTKYAPIEVDRLINMTYSTEYCQIAYEAYDSLLTFGIAFLRKLWHCVVMKGGETYGRETHGFTGHGVGGAISACVFRSAGIRPPSGGIGTRTDYTQ